MLDRFDYWEAKNGLKIVNKLTVHIERLCELQKVILNPRDIFYPEVFYYKAIVLFVDGCQVYRTKVTDEITARLDSPIEVIF